MARAAITLVVAYDPDVWRENYGEDMNDREVHNDVRDALTKVIISEAYGIVLVQEV